MLTLPDICDKLQAYDEISLLELLNITTADLIQAFADRIEEEADRLEQEINDEEIDD